MKKWFLLLLAFSATTNADVLKRLKVPQGFNISVFADNVDNAREMALGKNNIIYVGSFRDGKLHALRDTNGDGKADKKWQLDKNLNMPTGIAYLNGDLYVAVVDKILRYEDIDNRLQSPRVSVFYEGLPSDKHHGWKFLRFSPDGQSLIIPVGAPCNTCEPPTDKHSRIFALDMKTKKLTLLAEGVRNSVGFDFHPDTGQLWFSDNGRDMMGDDVPPDEINRISQNGQHFGYPYFHGGDIADPQFGKGKKAGDYVHPELKLGAHVAPLGIHFYRGRQFPKSYHKQLFIAEHGSWNRSKKAGYKVGVAILKNDKIVDYQDFVTGFMANEVTYGRPVALLELPDGSLLISDDYADAIYRVSYKNQAKGQ